ncbi:MAG: hypothetical protein O7A09_14215 [Proteobacteria bacterium]|nr:hypothetical protein [Pseudomonadota bacterium]
MDRVRVAAGRMGSPHLRSPRLGPAGLVALVLAAYSALSVWATWPLATRLADSLPMGTGGSATVPLSSAWSLWWTADRLAAGLSGLWNAPIFHPIAGSFAFSETVLLGGLATAPLFWLGVSPALAHNGLLLVFLVANGGFAFALLRAMRVRPALAGLGGAMILMLPYVHYEIGVLTLVPVWGWLWMLWAIRSLFREPSTRGGIRLGLAAAATSLLCAHYALFALLIVVPAGALLFGRRLADRELLRALVAAGGVAVSLAGPVAWTQLSAAREHEFVRSLDRAQQGAATPAAWISTPWRDVLMPPPLRHTPDPEAMPLFPGTARTLLALLGCVWAWRARRDRRWLTFLAAVGVAGLALSMAPRLEIADWNPYASIQDAIPGLAQARSLWRAGALTQIVAVLLACVALDLAARRAADVGSSAGRRGLAAAIAALGLLCVFEMPPGRQRLADVPHRADYADFAGWIDAHLGPGDALLHLPMPEQPFVHALEPVTRWMYATAWHGRPMVNGYSSYFPMETRRLMKHLVGCPDARAYAGLERRGVRAIVVEQDWLREHPGCGPPSPHWTPQYRDPTLGVVVFAPAF